MPPRKARQEQEVDAATARSILEVLEQGHEVPEEIARQLLRCNQPPCPPSCGLKGHKGNKDNPACTCMLVPPEGSYRKKGLWRKDHSSAAYGDDPAKQKREDPSQPPGLRNLGNTCYVNATLQMLGAIPLFRQALYLLEPPLVAGADFVAQLRDVFLQLEHGPRSVVDPQLFAGSLQLDHSIQQDGQEFLKLLLMQLETVFGASGNKAIARVLQQLFCGGFSFVTTCKACGRAGEASQRVIDFNELSLQVQDHSSLLESLVSLLSPEELVGDNQYDCAFCGGKRDATRQMVLRRLPPFLSLSLQRFVFDHRTFDKKKLTSKLSFPEVLCLAPALEAAAVPTQQWPDTPLGPLRGSSSQGQPGLLYDLHAVLLHKGNSASHGHYVAHVRSPTTGEWWRYDDETTEKMGNSPASHPGDHGTTAAAAAAAENGGGSDTEGAKGGKGAKGKGGSSKASSSKGGARGRSGRGQSRGRGKRGKGSGAEEQEAADVESGAPQLAIGDYLAHDSEEAALAAVAAAAAQEAAEAEAVVAAVEAATNGSTKPAGRRRGATKRSTPPAASTQQEQAAGVPNAAPSEASAQEDAPEGQQAANGNGSMAGDKPNSPAAAGEPPAVAAGGSGAAGPSPDVVISSGNAYLLVYRLRGWEPPADQQQLLGVGHRLEQLPEELQAAVQQLRSEFEAAVSGHAAMQAEAAARVAARQQEVRSITGELDVAAPGSGEPHLISAAWLEEWANSDTPPPPIDNALLLCEHGRLDPAKVSSMKLISGTAWGQLQASCGGGPELKLSELCPTCATEQLQQLVRRSEAHNTRGTLQQQLEECEALPEDALAPDSCYVSRPWLLGFKKRSTLSSNQVPPTAGITCQHGGLLPESSGMAAKRRALPREVFEQLVDHWHREATMAYAAQQKKGAASSSKAAAAAAAAAAEDGEGTGPSDVEIVQDQDTPPAAAAGTDAAADQQQPGGRSAATAAAAPPSLEAVKRFDLTTEDCPVCLASLAAVVEQQQEVQGALEEERAALSSLASGSIVLQLEPGETYYLVPNSWLAVWQVYISAASSKKQVGVNWVPAPRPPPLPEALRQVMCCCGAHPGQLRLREAPPAVVNKRGRFIQADPQTDALRVITAAHWQALLRYHSGVDLEAPLTHQQQQQQQGPGQQQQRGQPEVIDVQDMEVDAAAAGPAGTSAAAADGEVELMEVDGEPVASTAAANGQGGGAAAGAAATGRASTRGRASSRLQQQQQQQGWGGGGGKGGAQQLEAAREQLLLAAVEAEPLLRGIQAKLVLQEPSATAAAGGAVAAGGTATAPPPPAAAAPGQDGAAAEVKLEAATAAEQQLDGGAGGGDTAQCDTKGEPPEPQEPPAAAAAAAAGTVCCVKEEARDTSSPSRGQVVRSAAASPRKVSTAAAQAAVVAAEQVAVAAAAAVAAEAAAATTGLSQAEASQTAAASEDVETAGGSRRRGKRQREPEAAADQQPPPAAAAQADGEGDVEMVGGKVDQVDLTHQPSDTLVERVDLVLSEQEEVQVQDTQQQQQQQQQSRRGRQQQASAAAVPQRAPRGRAAADRCQAALAAAGSDIEGCEEGFNTQQQRRRKEDADWSPGGGGAAGGGDGDSSSSGGEEVEEVQGGNTSSRGRGRGRAAAAARKTTAAPKQRRRQGAGGGATVEGERPSPSPPAGGGASSRAGRGARGAAATGGGGRGGGRRGGGRTAGAATDEELLLADLEEEAAAVAAASAAMHLQGHLVTVPAVCAAHQEAQAAAARAAALCYEAANVMVEQIQAADLPTAFILTGAERKSRRARKGRQPVSVSSTTSLRQLKLSIFEALGLHPLNQQVYSRRGLLEGEGATLAELEVYAEEELKVVSSNTVPDDDYASAFDTPGGGPKKPREVELGFKNTLLGGGSGAAALGTTAAPAPTAGEQLEGQLEEAPDVDMDPADEDTVVPAGAAVAL